MATRTITAFFDSPAEAGRAADALAAAGIDRGAILSGGGGDDDAPGRGRGGGADLLAEPSAGFLLPEVDRHAYDEGVRRGGALLTATVDDARVDEAVRVLEAAGAADLDARAGEWRAAGWDPTPAARAAADELPPDEREVGRGTGRVRAYLRGTPIREVPTDDPQDDMMGLNSSHPARRGGL